MLQSDIIFIKAEREHIIDRDAIHGSPDIIFEIVSPLPTFYDTVEKKDVYRRYGVPEYWLIFPDEKAIEVLILENDEYVESSKAKKEGFIQSKIMNGLGIKLGDIFEFDE